MVKECCKPEEERAEKNLRHNNSAMLPQKRRLKKKEDFDTILRRGSSFFSQNCSIRFLKSQLPYSRFGIIVSKKEFRLATQRNQAKRRGWAIIRKYEKDVCGNKDVLVLFRKGIMKKTFNKAEEEIVSLMQKSNLVKK
jgi:ribonuclease P protein component